MNRDLDRLDALKLARACDVCYVIRVRLEALEDAMRDVAERTDRPAPVDVVSTCKVSIDCPVCRNTGHIITAEGKKVLSMLLALDDSDVVEVIGRSR